MIIKHYYDFGSSTNRQMLAGDGHIDWNILRSDDTNPAFALEVTREAYVENCKRAATYEEHATIIADLLKDSESACSLGVGKGILEWHLKQIRPGLRLLATDYTADAIDRLRALFPECDAFLTFDMRGGHQSTGR